MLLFLVVLCRAVVTLFVLVVVIVITRAIEALRPSNPEISRCFRQGKTKVGRAGSSIATRVRGGGEGRIKKKERGKILFEATSIIFGKTIIFIPVSRPRENTAACTLRNAHNA